MGKYKYKLKETSTIASNSGFTSETAGENIATPRAFKKSTKGNYGAYTQVGYKPVKEGPGANMGPGPKAGPEGVTDNTYVKTFKYKLVNQPALNKAAKGIEVKQLWETIEVEDYLNTLNVTSPERREFLTQRLGGFNILEQKLNQLVPLLQAARNKTLDYYKNNPSSYAVLYSTDGAIELIDDIINSFTPETNQNQ
jgi:spore coat protein CotH